MIPQAIRLYWWAFLAFFVVCVTSISASAADAELACLIKIEGKIYDASPCSMNTDDDGIITFGRLDELNNAGYWVYLIDNKDGTYDGFWNNEYGAPRAHGRLGVLRQETQAGGDCFSGNNVFLCRNMQSDTPVYYTELSKEGPERSSLFAFVSGVEYRLSHPTSEVLSPAVVMDSADFDNDGRLDTLISMVHGGNCCPDSISVVSYRGDGFFTFLDEAPIAGGWGGHKILVEADRNILRIYDIPAGYGGTIKQRAQRDYAFIDDKIARIAQRFEHSEVTEIASLSLDEVKFEPGGKKTLEFDLNNDGNLDEITCSYWERWGVLNCKVNIVAREEPLDLQCSHVAVTPVVFGPNRAHQLMCGEEKVEY